MPLRFFIIWLLLTIAPFKIWAQFTDDFADGDFTQNPAWTGDTAKFIVNPSFRLQLDAPPVTDTAVLVTTSQAVNNAFWEFYCKLDFAPSSSNFARVYLMSTTANLKGALNGYFVQIGGSTGTTDDVSLYRQNGNTITKIIDGTNGTVATNPELIIRTTRNTTGLWELQIDTGLTGSFVSQGSVTDNTLSTTGFFGVLCKYTSTRSDKFFYDNFIVTGTPYTDTIPPIVDSVSVLLPSGLEVYFNEKVTAASAQNTVNYLINNSVGIPTSASIDAIDSSVIHLNFGTAFLAGTAYTITVSNIEDLFGNSMGSQIVPFIAGGSSGVQFGDVVINEIMADPSPPVGLPDAEFIELYNATSQLKNLDSWAYSDASVTTSLPPFALQAGSYVILCAQSDTSLFSSFGQVIGLSPWPSLNNTGDFLGLRSDAGILIDTVEYTDSWYRDSNKENGGWSLERVNPLTNCSSSSNWLASTNNSGGTPGQQNSIFDTLPNPLAPLLITAKAIDSVSIQLIFDKPLDTTNLSAANFTMNQGVVVNALTVQSPLNILLHVAPKMDNSIVYQLSFANVLSCEGIPLADSNLRIAIGKEPLPYQLIISEIYANPNPLNIFLPEAEFVEIYNWSPIPVRLGNLFLSDRSTTTPLPNEVIFPYEYLVLCPADAASAYAKFGKTFGLNPWPSLNNSGDILELTNNTGAQINIVAYDDAWYKDEEKAKGGWSLEMINYLETCLGADNWSASIDSKGATPAMPSSIIDTTFSTPLKIVSVTVQNDTTLLLKYSKNLASGSLQTANFSIDNGLAIDSVRFKSPGFQEVMVFIASGLTRGTNYKLTQQQATDCSGKISTTPLTIPFIYPGFNNIIINEVLFDPRGSGSDFVELYNLSGTAIDLSDWQLAYQNNSGDTAYKLLGATPRVIYPGSFVVLTENRENIIFEYPNSVDSNFLEMDLPGYSNTSGTVTLVDPTLMTIDEFTYDESMHSPILSNTEGVTLERVSYTRPTNERTNWQSAASTAGFATPGKVNSQFAENPQVGGSVTINPKVFSPDNDGYNDFVDIHYSFDNPGYNGTITIFDANGGVVYTLLNNQSLSTSGTISWDGRNDQNEIVETGMYIVLFRTFDLDGKQQVFKSVVVVADK